MKRISIVLLAVMLFFCCISSSKSQSDNDKLKKKISDFYDVLNNQQYDKFGDYFTTDFTEYSPFPGQGPGLSGFIDAMKSFNVAFPDAKFTITDMIISDDDSKACVLSITTGTNKGDFMGMKATNKKIEVDGVDWLYFKDGKCTGHYGYMNNGKMMQQLGMQ